MFLAIFDVNDVFSAEICAFCKYLNGVLCVDASAQTYKPDCPPVVLTKLPLVTTRFMIDSLIILLDKAVQNS